MAKDNSETITITEGQYDEQLAALKDVAATSPNHCYIALYLAFVDSRVRQLFFNKISKGYVFQGVECLTGIGIPEEKRVLFSFSCPPGVFCLIPPSFLVVVNIIQRTVVSIFDPYIALENSASLSPMDLAPQKCDCHPPSTMIASQTSSSTNQLTLETLREACSQVTIENGKACLKLPVVGDVCVNVPSWVPNGTLAEACIDVCKKFGIPCGAKAVIRVAGQDVASASYGCC